MQTYRSKKGHSIFFFRLNCGRFEDLEKQLFQIRCQIFWGGETY